ncbi:MAG: acetoacetate decarboxylase family protein [Spirochaetia bacterium]
MKTNDGFFGALAYFWSMIDGRSQNLWDNARLVLADLPVSAVKAQRLLPFGLKLSAPAMATLFVAHYPKTSFTAPYREAALLLHVRHWLGTGRHCSWMVLDDDTALIYGRELLGYPKKMASLEFEEEGDRVRARVTRRGVTVLALEGTKGAPKSNPPPAFDLKTFNVGGPGSAFAFNPLWMFRPREVIHEARECALKLEVQPSEWDPLADLITGGPVNPRFVVMDVCNSRYNYPVGLSGPTFVRRNFNLRFR